MRIVVAPDKFKSSLDASGVCQAIAEGLRKVDPTVEVDLCPMADGGDGTVAALMNAIPGTIVERTVVGPLPDMTIPAHFALLDGGKTAVIEMSSASGVRLLQLDQRNPMRTTTFGVGQLLMAAAELGVRRIILGAGGSATVDCGIGCAKACGLPVLMNDGQPTAMTEPLVGADLERVVLVKHGRGSPVERLQIDVACDVDIPLYGPHGAAQMFAPQKGATPDQIQWFDTQLAQLASRSAKDDLAHAPGAGAAGGLAFAMAAFFGAKLRPGFDLIAEATCLAQRLQGADLCLTGEGRLDADTLRGKTVLGVARLCRHAGIPCVALVGSSGPGAENAIPAGLTAYFSIADRPMTETESIHLAPQLLSKTAANILRLFL